jgi:hypothetical protein
VNLVAQAGIGQQSRPQTAFEQLVQGGVQVRERFLDRGWATQVSAEFANFGHQSSSAYGQGLTHVLQDSLLGDAFQSQAAAGWEVRKAAFNLAIESSSGLGADRPKTRREAELAVLGSDEIQHGQTVLVVVQTQAASQLL